MMDGAFIRLVLVINATRGYNVGCDDFGSVEVALGLDQLELQPSPFCFLLPQSLRYHILL